MAASIFQFFGNVFAAWAYVDALNRVLVMLVLVHSGMQLLR